MTAWQHLRTGLRYGYPPCCAIWWALGYALGVYAAKPSGEAW